MNHLGNLARLSRAWSFLALALAMSAAGAEPRRVLLLHSFGRGFEPFSTFSENFRTELAKQLPEPLDFFDVALESARFEQAQEGPFVDYLVALFAQHRLDLVVPMGGPAVRFAQKYRTRLFAGIPMLIAAVDDRHLDPSTLTTNDAVIAVHHDVGPVIENMLRLLPGTTNLVVVLGDSPLERFWVEELRGEFQPFTNRLQFIWFNKLSFDEIKRRAAALPERTAIFYGQMSVDADGVPHEEGRALADLHAVASAPLFGDHDYQLGRGIIGGPLVGVVELSRQSAMAGARILKGESPAGIRVPAIGPGTPVYDWRELRRWQIPEAMLPEGSSVQFREPTTWERYKWRLVVAATLCVIEGVLIFVLVASLNHRRRVEKSLAENESRLREAELAAREFGGRLLSAQEAERARLGRELHDDISQRLARLAIDAGRLESGRNGADRTETMRDLRDGLVRLSEDVHSLSYKLHPAVLEDLGLSEALKAECEHFSRQEAIPVAVNVEEVPKAGDGGLCLFRVAQEALRNVARHAQADSVSVSLRSLDGGLQLVVSDTGAGFELAPQGRRPSLGLASMRERVRLANGDLDIESSPGEGTTVIAWVPLKEKDV